MIIKVTGVFLDGSGTAYTLPPLQPITIWQSSDVTVRMAPVNQDGSARGAANLALYSHTLAIKRYPTDTAYLYVASGTVNNGLSPVTLDFVLPNSATNQVGPCAYSCDQQLLTTGVRDPLIPSSVLTFIAEPGLPGSPVSAPAASLSLQGLAANTSVKTSAYTANLGERVLCNASGGNFNVTAPTAVGNANFFFQVAGVAATGVVTIVPTGGQTIALQANKQLSGPATTTLVSDGTNWMIF